MSRLTTPTRLSWTLLAWNVLSIGWIAAGHPGVAGTGGEGRVLVIITVVIIWCAGNVILGGARLLSARRHRKGL